MASSRSSRLSSVANGVKSAASYTAGVIPVLLTGTAAVAGAAGNVVVGAVSNSGHVFKCAGSAAKGVAGAAGGAPACAVAASTTVALAPALALKAIGFKTIGPAAGSYAAAWMQSNAIANGGGVAAGSLYSAVQSASMSGGLFLGAPTVLVVGAIAGATVWRARL